MIKVTCAIIVQNNSFLVTQRGENTAHSFQWEFPGGKIRKGESPEKCLNREIKEELCLEVEIVEPLISVQQDYGFMHIELIPFVCRIISGEIQLTDHVDYQWLSFSALFRMNLSEADLKLINHPKNRKALKKYSGK